jgi:hypothetical protein
MILLADEFHFINCSSFSSVVADFVDDVQLGRNDENRVLGVFAENITLH